MASSVIVHRQKKILSVFNSLGFDCSFEQFLEKFKSDYPKDWRRINSRYNKQRHKSCKGIPMPEPVKYMHNAYVIYKVREGLYK